MANGGPPTPRPSGRVVLLDDRARVLLFHLDLPDHDEPSLWVTPGGALWPGESFRQAALRELREETGLRVDEMSAAALGPCVWTRRHVFRAGERRYRSIDRFYLLHVPAFEVHDQQLEPEEREAITAHRWWTAGELAAATGEVFVPRGLAALLPPLLAGDLPDEPIEVR